MNMRKIIAILAAVLMLCSVIPMGVSAADGDVVASIDWNNGENKFNVGEVVAEGPDGSNCYKWAFGGGWSSNYTVINNMDPAKDYTISMKAKGSIAGGMGITIQNGDWGSYWNGPSFNVTTSWQDIVVTIPANSIPFAAGSILFKFQGVGGDAYDLYVDDLVISEGLPKAPPIVNGDFETGDLTGWNKHQNVTVTSAAAHDGSYGAHLKDNGTWGGILDQTLTVEPGKSYEISFWIQVNKTGINLQIRDGSASGASLASGTWFDYNQHSSWTKKSYIVTPSTNGIFLNFCGAGDGTPNPAMETDTYVDSIKVKELKDPSFDGYITNGDFETGDTQSWESVWNSAQIAAIEGGYNSDYAMQVNFPGQWQIVRQKVNVKPNTDYVFSVYAKDNNGAVLLVKDGNDSGNIKQGSIASSSEWKKNSIEFNSGSWSQVYLCLMSNAAGNSVVVDDFFMYEKQPASNDGYIVNGTFETGDTAPWDNLWGSCPKAEVVMGGYNDNFSLDLVSGEWKHFRQTNIAVEANTEYKITLWSKNVKNMSLLVKDGGDSTNIVNKGIANSSDWAKTEVTFNTGSYTTILVSFMGGAAEAYGQFDNIVMECLHVCNVVEQERVEADCVNDGYIKYACDCGLGEYTETIPAKGHTPGAEADCDSAQVCEICGVELAPATGAHIYTNEYDIDCNVCGTVREVDMPVIGGGTSVSEDVSGVAAKFEVTVEGLGIIEGKYTQADYTNATMGGYKLITMGVVASNNVSSVEIEAKYLCDLDVASAAFAARVINIPADKLDVEITFQSYFVIEIDGVATTIYGGVQTASYNGVLA